HVHLYNGLAIAAHIDRESFSVLGQLGFIDPGLPFDALEVSHRTGISNARRRYPELSPYLFIESSDAHSIGDIGQGVTTIFLREGTIGELKMALAGRQGRYVEE
ncbi:MAG: PHP-associated domain-containing protein, partial [Smithellaceae bacterium]|nr:PHP-associated domain-containing protein [Smithellaceae bacterium]